MSDCWSNGAKEHLIPAFSPQGSPELSLYRLTPQNHVPQVAHVGLGEGAADLNVAT